MLSPCRYYMVLSLDVSQNGHIFIAAVTAVVVIGVVGCG